MPQSSTLDSGLDVHKAAMAVADVATAHDAEVIDLGMIGTRQADIDQSARIVSFTAPGGDFRLP
jgi:hypothetical protein